MPPRIASEFQVGTPYQARERLRDAPQHHDDAQRLDPGHDITHPLNQQFVHDSPESNPVLSHRLFSMRHGAAAPDARAVHLVATYVAPPAAPAGARPRPKHPLDPRRAVLPTEK